VIRSLEVRDLVVIERAELEPAPGLTAITGETGAGKTVLAQALSLLAGGPADAAAVRPGARHALVQATLALPEPFWERLEEDDPALALRDLAEDDREVVLSRRVPADGRARAYLDGQATSREAVVALAGALLRFSGQGEGRRLVSPAVQLAVLDAHAGQDTRAAAERLTALRRRARALERALAEARARRAAGEREREELEELVAAVAAVSPDPEEHATLLLERERLRHAGRLAEAAGTAAAALSDDDRGGALARLGEAERALAAIVDVDPALAGPREDLAAAAAAAQEALLALGAYLAALEAEPGRLDEVEARLDAYHRLARRHGPPDATDPSPGGAIRGLIERAARAREELDAMRDGAAEDEALAARHAATVAEAREVAADLAARRREAAPRLEVAVASELADLGMSGAHVRVEVAAEPGDPPVDRVTLWLRANPGLREAPLAQTASGGELSRVLLALHSVAAAADRDATWVLDEVDAGVGGVTAVAVGAKLAALARARQVVVITHLPQVAARADVHYGLVKDVAPDGRARTVIEPLAGDALVAELCRMLGATPDDPGARARAEELLRQG
jgi:DNA repair protein RecN (Recombination protein N)